jgi:hypothetical protein
MTNTSGESQPAPFPASADMLTRAQQTPRYKASRKAVRLRGPSLQRLLHELSEESRTPPAHRRCSHYRVDPDLLLQLWVSRASSGPLSPTLVEEATLQGHYRQTLHMLVQTCFRSFASRQTRVRESLPPVRCQAKREATEGKTKRERKGNRVSKVGSSYSHTLWCYSHRQLTQLELELGP